MERTEAPKQGRELPVYAVRLRELRRGRAPLFTVHTVHYRTPSHRSERLLPSLVRWAT